MKTLLAAAGLGAVVWALAKREPGTRVSDGQVVRGARYVAVYAIPPGFPATDTETLAKLDSILPPDSSVEVDGQKLVITMTAVSNHQIGDVPTPLGTLKLVSLRRLSDVVGSLEELREGMRPALYTFSGYYKRSDGMGLKWSGWTKPVTHTFSSAQQYMLASPWVAAQAYRWDAGKRLWVRA